MVKSLITALGLMIGLFVVGILSFQNQSKIDALEKSPDRGKLTWYAEIAKAKGQQEISFPAELARYAVPRDLDEAIAYYNVVYAEPVESKSYASNERIYTWYKFRIIEELSSPTMPCINCPRFPEAPGDLLPLQEGEFLTAKFGGEVVVDGIRVISTDLKFPPFKTGKRYLLFLDFDDNKTIAALRMGPWGAFKLDSDDKLEAVDKSLKHSVERKLRSEFGNSLARLRVELKKASGPK